MSVRTARNVSVRTRSFMRDPAPCFSSVGVIGYSLPYRFSETLDMADLALVPIWGDKLEATWRGE